LLDPDFVGDANLWLAVPAPGGEKYSGRVKLFPVEAKGRVRSKPVSTYPEL
jgi:hypothetical protein